MNLTLRALLCVSVIGASLSSAKADGPTDYPGYVDGEPSQVIDADSSQVYQPPPEGVCFDDENQSYDCSKDEDYQSYSSIDDGYDPGAHEDFRDALAPYGQWVQTAQYGNVWVPSSEVVGADFTPYFSGGRWSYTDYGWTWVSEYNWGWAPFHYGRWLTVPGYGWSWVPGRIWGPAWVHWRSGGGYVGWAPLPPRGMVIARPVPGSRWNYWNFTAPHQLLLPRLQRLAPAYLPSIYGRTVITTDFRSIGSTRVVVGPPLHHFPGVRVVPAPLGSLQIALPRSHVVVRPGVPLGSRTYYTPHYRPTWGSPTGSLPRPGFPPVYQRPATPPPYQQRPGGWNQPGQAPPYQQRPGGWNQPGQAPPYQQRPGGGISRVRLLRISSDHSPDSLRFISVRAIRKDPVRSSLQDLNRGPCLSSLPFSSSLALNRGPCLSSLPFSSSLASSQGPCLSSLPFSSSLASSQGPCLSSLPFSSSLASSQGPCLSSLPFSSSLASSQGLCLSSLPFSSSLASSRGLCLSSSLASSLGLCLSSSLASSLGLCLSSLLASSLGPCLSSSSQVRLPVRAVRFVRRARNPPCFAPPCSA